MIILAVLSENTVQCRKTLFSCLFYIFTCQIASFWVFVQWTDLGSKNLLQLAHSGYQGYLDFWDKSLRWFLVFQFIVMASPFCKVGSLSQTDIKNICHSASPSVVLKEKKLNTKNFCRYSLHCITLHYTTLHWCMFFLI